MPGRLAAPEPRETGRAGPGAEGRRRREAGDGRRRIRLVGDVLAGLSVALVLIPQSLAYAALAGMPPERGLYAATLPLLVAAPLASSPYLQTGPVAVTSLLSFGVLSTLAVPGSDEYVALGMLLAVIVGVARIAVGLLHTGVVAYLMSRPMLLGFVPAAALLIAASQLPTAVGVAAPEDDIVTQALWTVGHPGTWDLASLALSGAAALAIAGGRLVHPMFPGVLAGVGATIGVSLLVGYDGPKVGSVSVGLPPLSLDLPWAEAASLLVAGAVIALVGFAEAASIARQFATEERSRWSPDREFVSQGAANLAAGVSGGFPVGGSFSRTSLNRLMGARTRLSGAVTGLAVLAFLPVAFVLSPLPKAVLGAIVIVAVAPLVRLRPVLRLWRVSRPQFLVAAATFALTLALAPRVERAVLAGIGLSIAVHLWRELRVDLDVGRDGDVLCLRPHGVLWYGTAQALQDRLLAHLEEHRDARRLVLQLEAIGRLDLTSALALRTVLEQARRAGLDTEVDGVEERDRRLIEGVVEQEADPLAD